MSKNCRPKRSSANYDAGVHDENTLFKKVFVVEGEAEDSNSTTSSDIEDAIGFDNDVTDDYNPKKDDALSHYSGFTALSGSITSDYPHQSTSRASIVPLPLINKKPIRRPELTTIVERLHQARGIPAQQAPTHIRAIPKRIPRPTSKAKREASEAIQAKYSDMMGGPPPSDHYWQMRNDVIIAVRDVKRRSKLININQLNSIPTIPVSETETHPEMGNISVSTIGSSLLSRIAAMEVPLDEIPPINPPAEKNNYSDVLSVVTIDTPLLNTITDMGPPRKRGPRSVSTTISSLTANSTPTGNVFDEPEEEYYEAPPPIRKRTKDNRRSDELRTLWESQNPDTTFPEGYYPRLANNGEISLLPKKKRVVFKKPSSEHTPEELLEIYYDGMDALELLQEHHPEFLAERMDM